MPPTATEIALLIQRALPDAVVLLAAVTPDGSTVSACVSSKAFEGLSADERHDLVYAALKERMGERPRTLQLTTNVAS